MGERPSEPCKISPEFYSKDKENAMGMNVAEFDDVARNVFATVYITLAKQIKEETDITRGVCLDVGSGGGYLSIALAKITNLDFVLLDRSQEMLDIAERNIVEAGLENRLRILLADVHEIPLNDCSVDIVVSRGSVFFWEDQTKAFKEIYRVLAPGGVTFIGGGFGSAKLKKRVDEKMMARQKDWLNITKERLSSSTMMKFRAALDEAGVPAEIRQIEAGFGIMIKRSAV